MIFFESYTFIDIILLLIIIILSLLAATKNIFKNIIFLILTFCVIIFVEIITEKVECKHIYKFIFESNTVYIIIMIMMLSSLYLFISSILKIFIKIDISRFFLYSKILILFIALIRYLLVAAIIASSMLNSYENIKEYYWWKSSKLIPILIETSNYVYNIKFNIENIDIKSKIIDFCYD